MSHNRMLAANLEKNITTCDNLKCLRGAWNKNTELNVSKDFQILISMWMKFWVATVVYLFLILPPFWTGNVLD